MNAIVHAVNYVTGGAATSLPSDYLASGNFQFNMLKSNGLKPEMRLLEIGCGCLLTGRLLVDYLAAGHYTALEPNTWLVTTGSAHFGINKQFTVLARSDFSSTGTYDFILSHSILSHACTEQLIQFFKAVKTQLLPDGIALVSLRLADKDSNYSAWFYQGPSFFCVGTVEKHAQASGLKLTYRSDIQAAMIAATGGEHHHDWIELKHL